MARFFLLFGIALIFVVIAKIVPPESAYKELAEGIQMLVFFLVLVTIAVIEIREERLLNYPDVTRSESPFHYYLELAVVIALAIFIPLHYFRVI